MIPQQALPPCKVPVSVRVSGENVRCGAVPVSAKDNGTEKFGPSDEKKFSFVPKKILAEKVFEW